MKEIIQSAIGDGAGQTSMMRVVVFIVIVAVVGAKFYNAYLTKSPIVWDSQDLELAGIAFSGKLIQNTQEK